jgi:penicillin amidase
MPSTNRRVGGWTSGRCPGVGTVTRSTNSGGGDNQTAGPSFRIIVEAGNWDAAVGANNPGQSGDPESPHYRDLFQLWSQDRYFSAYYSRELIESVANRTINHEPPRCSGSTNQIRLTFSGPIRRKTRLA